MCVWFYFSHSFVSFFGPLALQIFPLLKLLIGQHQTRRVSKKCIYLETQLNKMELSADCSEIGNSLFEYKRNPGWNVSIKFALTCTPHHNMEFSADCIQIGEYLIMLLSVKSPSACTPHSKNDQISKKIKLCARLTEYYQSKVWLGYRFDSSLRMIFKHYMPGSKQKYGMYSERRIVLQNPVSYKKSITKILRWLYMSKSVRISQ